MIEVGSCTICGLLSTRKVNGLLFCNKHAEVEMAETKERLERISEAKRIPEGPVMDEVVKRASERVLESMGRDSLLSELQWHRIEARAVREVLGLSGSATLREVVDRGKEAMTSLSLARIRENLSSTVARSYSHGECPHCGLDHDDGRPCNG